MQFCRLVAVDQRTGEVREYFSRYMPWFELERVLVAKVKNDPDGGDPVYWKLIKVKPA